MQKRKSDSIKIAVFDVDGTFLYNTSAEILLVRFLRKKGLLPFFNFIKTILWLFRMFPLDPLEATLKNKMFLKGILQADILCGLPEFYEMYLKPNLYMPLYYRMRELQREGYRIIFISATLDFILDFIIDELDADGGMAANMVVRKGRFTGMLTGIYPYYRGKVRALDHYLMNQEVDYRQSYAFADRWEDIPLLERFGHPIAVNPTRRLRKEANRRGWVIQEQI